MTFYKNSDRMMWTNKGGLTMRIRGTLKGQCKLCRFYVSDKNSLCGLTQNETTPKDSCPKFKYDIFKYTPSDKNNMSKFSKEDFEI